MQHFLIKAGVEAVKAASFFRSDYKRSVTSDMQPVLQQTRRNIVLPPSQGAHSTLVNVAYTEQLSVFVHVLVYKLSKRLCFK